MHNALVDGGYGCQQYRHTTNKTRQRITFVPLLVEANRAALSVAFHPRCKSCVLVLRDKRQRNNLCSIFKMNGFFLYYFYLLCSKGGTTENVWTRRITESVVLGLFLFLYILFVLFCFLRRRKKKKQTIRIAVYSNWSVWQPTNRQTTTPFCFCVCQKKVNESQIETITITKWSRIFYVGAVVANANNQLGSAQALPLSDWALDVDLVVQYTEYVLVET